MCFNNMGNIHIFLALNTLLFNSQIFKARNLTYIEVAFLKIKYLTLTVSEVLIDSKINENEGYMYQFIMGNKIQIILLKFKENSKENNNNEFIFK